MPQGNRPGDQRRADATAARAKGATTRAVGTTRGETTGGSRSNSRGGMSPIGSSQPPSMGLSQSAINNASFIDYRRTPGDTARTTLDLGRFARPSQDVRNAMFHSALRATDKQFKRDAYSDETRSILDPGSVSFGKRPPVIKGSNTTTSPLSAKHNTAERKFSKLASDTRREHRQFQGQNRIDDEMTSRNVDVAKTYARQHQDLGKETARDHMNTYVAKQTADMRSRVNQPGGEKIGNRNHVVGTKTTSSKGASTGRKLASVGTLAAGAFAAGQAGVKSVDTRSAAEKMRDDASDMGPVKGRVMERRTYQAAGGTRPTATKIVPYEGQTKTSRLLGVSNVKAGQN
jgi:hypothetical protein